MVCLRQMRLSHLPLLPTPPPRQIQQRRLQMQPMRLRVLERTMNRLHLYIVCNTCESLFSPEKEVCSVCGQAVEIGAKPRAFRVLPHVVCGNCGSLVSAKACFCPFCETSMNRRVKCEIVEQPVELEIIGLCDKRKSLQVSS